jgi:L-ascorbate metabolism protein UlaG (beta-lactamase superfamily)
MGMRVRLALSRRWLLAGLGLGGAGAALTGAALYRFIPRSFWNQYWAELQRDIQTPPLRPALSRWSDRGLYAAWIGHSTVLIRLDGFTILTDPVFSAKAGIHFGPFSFGVKRLVHPAVGLAELPAIDLVLLSHAHMDHFDIPSLRALENAKGRVVTAWETADLLRVNRYRQVDELRWGQRLRVGPVTVQAVEVNHWGARMRSDTWRGYNGYVIENGRYRVLFAGDTAITDAFKGLRTRRGFDLAIFPIGAYNPWIRYHCNPEQAWGMAEDAGAEFLVPVHHQTFVLSREPQMEPIERFLACAGSREDRVPIRRVGQEFSLVV